MIDVLRWIVRRVGPGTLVQLTLLYFALGCVAYGLAGVVKGLDLFLLIWTAICAVLCAWVMARSKIKTGWAAAILIGFGLAIILVFQGHLGNPLLILAQRTTQYMYAGLRWLLVKNAVTPDPTLLTLAGLDLQNQAVSVISHFSAWLSSFGTGHITFDTLVDSILWGFLLWVLSCWAAWQIRRYEQPLRALVPAAGLLAGVLNFVRPSPYILLPVVATTLILMIMIGQQKREQRWAREKIDYTSEIIFDTAFTAIPILILILGAAALAPSISVYKVVALAHSLFEKQSPQMVQLGKSLGLNPEAGNDYFTRGMTKASLPQLHLLGSGPELSKKIVMEVKVTSASSQGNPEVAYYWRSLTYDQYSGAGWVSSGTRVLDYRAGDQVVSSSVPDHSLVLQEVHFVQNPDGLLYHTGELVTADQDYQAAWRLPVETGPDLFGASLAKGNYSAKSLVPVVSQKELRLAGTVYPDWVKARYLELPTTLPGRVSDLARELTRNQPTPYDQAIAIQSYLRTYTYTLDLPAPPADRDVADYFLFDLKKGYCDYYATAMVVLARAAGLPARFVTGYASGTFDSRTNQYTVTQADGHSWPEVYFPKYGWVEFEPTAGRSAIILPDRLPPPEIPAASGKPPAIGWLVLFKPGIASTVGLAFIVLILIAVGWQAGNAWRLRSLHPAKAAADIYRRFRRSSRKLDPTLPAGETPYELSQAVSARLKNRNMGKIWAALCKPAARDAEQIAKLYSMAEYSLHPLLPAEKNQAIKAWWRLRWRLQLARIWGKTRKNNGS